MCIANIIFLLVTLFSNSVLFSLNKNPIHEYLKLKWFTEDIFKYSIYVTTAFHIQQTSFLITPLAVHH